MHGAKIKIVNFLTAIHWILMLYILLEIYYVEVRSVFTFYSKEVASFSPVKLHCVINCHTNMKPQTH
jgi:hypothetical protein